MTSRSSKKSMASKHICITTVDRIELKTQFGNNFQLVCESIIEGLMVERNIRS